MAKFGYNLTKSYVYHTGLTKVSKEALLDFKRSFPELDSVAGGDIAGIIEDNLPAVLEEVNPVVNMDTVFKAVSGINQELRNFKTSFKQNPLRVDETEKLIEVFPFRDPSNRIKLTASLRAVYAADEMESLPPAPTPEQPVNNPFKEHSMQAENKPMQNNNEAAKLTEDILTTLDEILVNQLFKSKLVPSISIKGLKKVNKGYVVDLCFVAPADPNVKLYASAVVLTEGTKRKMMPPVVLYDAEGQELGAFEKVTFDNAFNLDNHAQSGQGDYQKELDNLLSTATPVQANAILNRIINRWGSDQGYKAFMTYSQRNLKLGKQVKDTPYSRVNVQILEVK